MTDRLRGFTVVDLLVVLVCLALAGALLMALFDGIHPTEDWRTIECMNNVKNLVFLLEDTAETEASGLAWLLALVDSGRLDGERDLEMLFCPGDMVRSLEAVGGPAAYRQRQGAPGRYASYAVRDRRDSACRALRVEGDPVVLICDDSDDHHAGGFVVGLSGGAVKWRDKVDDWGLEADATVAVGEGSAVEELRCLRRE